MPIFEKWYARYGRYGRKYWIKGETRKTETKLDNWIWTQLTGSAIVLAPDLLHDSHMMSHGFYTFVDTSYKDTIYSGKFDSTQAWKITSSFAKRIFTEIGYTRVSARYSINIDSPWSSGAGILFATLYDHSSMR